MPACCLSLRRQPNMWELSCQLVVFLRFLSVYIIIYICANPSIKLTYICFVFACLLYRPWVQIKKGALRPQYHYYYFTLIAAAKTPHCTHGFSRSQKTQPSFDLSDITVTSGPFQGHPKCHQRVNAPERSWS